MLVDCGPDLRQQLLAAEVGRLDGVIVTHDHGDHCHGIDELRPVSQAIGGPVPLYARADVLDELKQRFGYAFEQSDFYRPIVEAREIGAELSFGDARVALRRPAAWRADLAWAALRRRRLFASVMPLISVI